MTMRSLNFVARLTSDLIPYIGGDRRTPVVYFDKVRNVGDLLNPYIVPKITGQETRRSKSNVFAHLRAIGSVLGSANRQSYIWGSGSIDGNPPRSRLDPQKIRAVRGVLTREMLYGCGYPIESVPLGDPAVLLPRYYSKERVAATFRIGVVPHFSDMDILLKGNIVVPKDCLVIDVAQEPEAFIDSLLKCDFIVSSSLHGLILADAYGISNVWASFSDRLLGGEFKFMDYYTTTDSPKQVVYHVATQSDFTELLKSISSIASRKLFKFNTDDLLDAFPREMKSV
ncbi:polysaccharide pyruvyl transferase family protein [Mesorhizobium sp. M1380]|uniref:polysaccharide pyruvyl transferase family protein n=1 Tax=Mesorhizobium sp. M1380 TaxID=2957093 RepID=UPI003337C9D2